MADDARESWRVVLFTDAAGEFVTLVDQALQAAGHQLVAVVTSPGPKKRRSDTYLEVVKAVRPAVDVLVSTRPNRWAPMLSTLQPDLILSMGFLWIIPQAVIDLPRLGAYNVHAGLLPKGRGPNPMGWAFRNDEGALGLSIHRMESTLDAGPVLHQERVPYGDDDDFSSLLPQLFMAAVALLTEALEKIAAGVEPVPQDESMAYTAGMFEDEWREIDWNQPARSVHNQVRSWFGTRGVPHGAFGSIDGERVLVTKTRLSSEPSNGAAPGTVLTRDDAELLIQCGDGPLRVLAWEHVVE